MEEEKDNGTLPKKPVYKKWWFWLIVAVIVLAIFGDNSTTGAHIYDRANVKDVMNGSRTEKIGKYSIIKVDSAEVTMEALTDWYFNYVSVKDYNWCMILYTDRNDNSGVYAIHGMVLKDVFFKKDEYGDYMMVDSSNSIFYSPTNDNTLKETKFEK